MIQIFQKKIEEIYRLRFCPDATQYILSPLDFKKYFKTLKDKPQVIYQDQEGDARIGIYFGKKIFRDLSQKQRFFSFQDFCIMAEEVSHFVYLIWSKCNNKKINLLDLEIQAEIDKFVLACDFFRSELMVIDKIFENVSYRENLERDESHRYWTANRLVKKLALDWRSKKTSRKEKMNWLRFFYRQNPVQRISMIERGLL